MVRVFGLSMAFSMLQGIAGLTAWMFSGSVVDAIIVACLLFIIPAMVFELMLTVFVGLAGFVVLARYPGLDPVLRGSWMLGMMALASFWMALEMAANAIINWREPPENHGKLTLAALPFGIGAILGAVLIVADTKIHRHTA